MESISLLTLSIAVGAFALIAVLVIVFIDRRRFRGYEEFRHDARVIQSFLKGELFRDVDDLVVTGGSHGFRTTVRFSRGENTPGLTIRMSVPSNLNMMIIPKDAPVPEGGVVIRIGDDQLDNKFLARTDQPTQARLFLSLSATIPQLRRLCCSSRTYFNAEHGSIELIELIAPEEDTAEHLMAHIQSLAALGPTLGQMPGASEIQVEKIAPPRPIRKYSAAIAFVSVLAVGIAALVAFEHRKSMDAAEGSTGAPIGIPNEEAQRIPNLRGWRLATSGDFDSAGVDWLKTKGIAIPSGRIEADFSGTGVPADHAYVLINAEGTRRLVVTSSKEVLYDSVLPGILLAARVPKASMAAIPLQMGTAATGNTDGLLVVGEKDNLQSAMVVSFNGSSVISAVPKNYQEISLE